MPKSGRTQHESAPQDFLQAGGIEVDSLVTGGVAGRLTARRAAAGELLARLPLVAHPEAVSAVQPESPLVELGRVPLHVPKPQVRDLLALLPCPLPHQAEVVGPAVVLRDRDGVIQVQHAMPPVAWHEDDVAGALDALVDLQLGMSLLDPGEDEVKVHDGLVVLALADHVPPLHDPLVLLRLEEHPTLAPVRDGVPGGCAQGVDVHRRSRTLRPDAEPAVRRSRIVVDQCKPVVGEVFGLLVVVHQRSDVAVVVHVGLEEVERAVVLLPADVVGVVLELHPQLLALVVLGHLERDILEPLLERLY
mmetsp:Transcript_46251/g.138242  ORF Transcript_46251/g.138242 Transcript_46251/m.138242 type:complete len:305 (+) Transcript_46251:429-1343(+)